MRNPTRLGLVVGLMVSAGVGQAATIVQTLGSWNGSDRFGPFGMPNTRFFGQTLEVPAVDSTLVSFDFRVDQYSAESTTYTASVYAWDAVNSRATGAPLFQSPSRSLDFSGVFQTVTETLPGGGVAMTPGQIILIMFEATGTSGGGVGSADFGRTSETALANGSGWALNWVDGTTTPTTATWGAVGGDFAFRANFAPVPEPPTAVSLALLVGAGGFVVWRRRAGR